MSAEPPAEDRFAKKPAPIITVERILAARYRPWVVGTGLALLLVVVGAAFVIGLAPRRRGEAPAPPEAQTPPAEYKTTLPKRYDEPGALPPPGSGGLPPPEAQALAASSSPAPPLAASAPPVSAEVQQARDEARAARASGPFFGGGRSTAPTAAPPAQAALALSSPSTDTPAPLSAKEQFIARTAAGGPGAPILPRAPLSPFEVKAGTLVSAALVTGIQSDLPGPVIAQVSAPVFDHRTGQRVLIPQGARLIGRYDSQVSQGQSRVLVVWTQIVFPSGRSVDLGAMAGLDPAGMSGFAGEVDHHGGRLARAIGLSTLITMAGTAAQNSLGRGDDRVVLQDGAGGVAVSASQTGQRLVERDLQRAPTLTIAPGQPVRLLIERDLILPPETTGPGSSGE